MKEVPLMLHFSEEIVQMYEGTKPAYTKVYCILRDSIVVGDISQEDRLTEVAISEALDVSRTPVRAALQKLKEDGFLSDEKKRVTTSKQLSRKERADMLEFDCFLEGFAARLAAREQDMELLNALEEIQSAMYELNHMHNLSYKEAPGLRDLSFQFHTTIAKASKNKFLYKAIVDIRTLMRMHQAPQELREQTGGRDLLLQYQRKILDCIREGDQMGARLWMEADIYSAKNMYINSQMF